MASIKNVRASTSSSAAERDACAANSSEKEKKNDITVTGHLKYKYYTITI
jgi:hypothetical protein